MLVCWLNLTFERTFNTLWRCPCHMVPFSTRKLSMKLCPNFVTSVMFLGTCGSSAPMLLPALHQRVSLRLWLEPGVFFTAWALRYLPLVSQDTISLSQLRVLPRIPQLQLLWNLNKLLVMTPLMAGLWWSLGENPRSTLVTSPKGRKCLQLQLSLLCPNEVMFPLTVLVWLIHLVQGQ